MLANTRYQPGDRIGGNYLVHRALKGGMGEVYLCLDEAQRIPVALKTFQARFLTNPRLRDAFKTEVATWIALGEHPNIVCCFFMDTIDSLPFMHLEWVPGDEARGNDLRDWLNHGTLSTRRALQFTIDVCNGLIHASVRQPGIVHRDLKPENILVALGRMARITDWGLAKLVQQTNLHIPDRGESPEVRRSLIGTGGVVGTPAYMAPEQWSNGELDIRTDIYALGCVLYEMVTRESPYTGKTIDELRRQHLSAAIPKLPTGVESHEQMNQLLGRCLAKQVDERFSSAQMLLDEMSRLFEQQFSQKPRILQGSEVTADQLMNRGCTYHNLGMYQEALADFTRAVQLDPNNGKIRTVLGNTYFRLGRFDDSLAEHNRAIKLEPNDLRAYSNRGNTLAEMSRSEEAIKDFNKAIQLAPREAFPLINRGLTYSQMGRYEEALADFAQAIKNSPREASIYYNRGGTFLKLERLDEALDDLSRAIQLDPAFPKAYILRAQIHIALNRHDDAKADLTQALRFDPTDLEVYLMLGAFLMAQGATSEFEYLLQQAMRHCGKQAIAQRIGDLIQGEERNPHAWEAYGLFLASAEAFEDALKFFDKAILLNPTSASLILNKGTVLHKLRRYDEALTCFDQVLGIDPSNVIAWHNKGNLFGMTGRFREALECFQQALRYNPSYGPSQHGMMQAMNYLRRQGAEPTAQESPNASTCPRCGLKLPLAQFEVYRTMHLDGIRLQCPRCSANLMVFLESGRVIER